MTKKKLSVLVSYPDHFEITEIKRDLSEFQKIVGGYIEAVPRPHHASDWFAYCNEEGKFEGLPVNPVANVFLDKLYRAEGALPFTSRDVVVGNLVWFGNDETDASVEASILLAHIQRYAATALEYAWRNGPSDSPVITVIRDGQDIWVFDQRKEEALIPQRLGQWVKTARTREEHGTIEVWTGITPAAWVELRVELMDDVTGIRLHDERDDKSYG